MPKGMLFWIVYLIALLFALYVSWPLTWHAAWLVFFVLIGLLGWGVYGKPVQ